MSDALIGRVKSPDNVSVTTSITAILPAVKIDSASSLAGLKFVTLQPAGTIYVGDAAVTTTTGIKVVADEKYTVPMSRGQLYAVAGGTVACRVLLGFE